MQSPKGHVADNWRIAEEPEDVSAGGVFMWHPEPDAERVFVYVIAYPREAERYGRLLDWGEARGRLLTAGVAGRAHSSAGSGDELLAGILRKRGYELVRYFFTMEIDLTASRCAPDWPEGIDVRDVPARARSARSTTMDMEAFQDHWDFFSVPFDDWRDYFLGSATVRPRAVVLARGRRRDSGGRALRRESRPETGG